jgi:hypothetical protein
MVESALNRRQPVPLLTELGLNGLHVEQGTPELDDVLIVGRGDPFKLVLSLAFE